jgi:hypothetical protein
MPSAPETRNSEPHERELFVANLTPYELFTVHVGQLKDIVDRSKDIEDEGEILPDSAMEVCLIGLVSYFEAFCKHQFAALINICPPLLEQFAERRIQSSVKLKDIVLLMSNLERQIGFVIAEQYDFGSPELINGIFRDLISVTPFSKGEAHKYTQLLNDRHLLVHHAGIYTIRYATAQLSRGDLPENLFRNSIVVTREDYFRWSNFLTKMAVKIIRATTSHLREFIEQRKILLPRGKAFALEYLLVDIDISIAEILRKKKESGQE